MGALRLGLLLHLAAQLGCSSAALRVVTDAGVLGAPDGGPGGGSDGGSEVASDGGAGSGADGGPEVGPDGGPGAGSDGGPVVGADGGTDGGSTSAGCVPQDPPGPLPALAAERAFPALSFASPVAFAAPPDGTDRIFVVEQTGQIRVFPNRADVASASLFLDLSAKVHCCGEEGLLGIAFHPQYAQNRFFFVYYTQGSPAPSVLARYQTLADDPDRADPQSELVLLGDIPQPYANHNGGQLAFGPDGYLYLGLGDGGSGGDPQNNGQSLTTLLGKILRLDVDHSEGGLPYAIPADNPFRGQGGGVRGEIWAYGLRNPWRFSFDAGGRLWCGDVGQDAWEEIDLITRGGNYGWRLMEGAHCYNPPTDCNDGTLTLPLTEYGHDQGCAVTGGFVYRGSRVPELCGAYLYGDYCSGRLGALRYDGPQVTAQAPLASTGLNISSFGLDQAGELYVVDLNGGLYWLRRSP